jgi:uncharacterized protein (DUF58 family)
MENRRNAVFVLTLLALLGGLITGRDLFFTLAYLLGLLIVFSFFWAWSNIHWVYLSRVTRTRRTQVGRPLEERFLVRNTSLLPKLWLEVRDHSTLPEHYASQVVNGLGARDTFAWRVNTLCRERGRFQLGPLTLRSSDPFGFFPMERHLTPTSHIVVYPMTVDVHQFALPVGVLPGGDALRRRTHYVTTNAAGVREYAPGDSFSRIHWPSTARRDRMIVKEFELDPLADIWIVPDLSVLNHVVTEEKAETAVPEPGELPSWMKAVWHDFKLPATTEEYTVSIAASLCQYFLRRSRAVGLMAYGQSHEVIQPDRGERQLNRILETLAVLRAGGQWPLQNMLNARLHMLPRGTTVIAITPMTQQTWATAAHQLTRRGMRVVTILVDPSSFGGRYPAAPLASLLQASGILTYMVKRDDDLTAVLSASQRRAGYYVTA